MALHADTQNYLTRLAAAGGTISTFNTNLLDTMIVALHAGGLRGGSNPLRYWLKLNLTESFTGCLVPVYDDGVGNATNVGGFTSANWSPTNGLTNAGTGGRYIDSNWNPTTKLGTLSSSSCSIHMGVWHTVCTLNPLGFEKSGFMGGANDSVTFNDYNQIVLLADGSVVSLDVVAFSPSGEFIYDETAIGFTLSNRTSPSAGRLLLNNTLLATYGAVSGSMVSPNFDYPLMGTNDPSGLVNQAYGSFTNFTMGTGLTTGQETALYNALSITEPAPNIYYASPLMLAFAT